MTSAPTLTPQPKQPGPASKAGWLPTSLRGLFTVFMCWMLLISSTLAATEQVTYLHTDISGSPIAATDAQNFSQLRPGHQQNLLHHWQDVARHQELRSIAQDVLKGP